MEDRKETQNHMDMNLSGIKSSKLTLNPEERPDFGFFEEPSLAPDGQGEDSEDTGAAAGAVKESMLTPEERQQVEEFSRQIDVTDVKMVNAYGSGPQNGVAAFSESITGNVKTKEFGDIGNSLSELTAAISSTNAPEKKGLFGLFQKGKQKVTYLISNYETAETSIRKIEKDIQKHRQVLMKDIYIFDQMYDKNLEFYKELTMYIIAGKKALERAKNTKLVSLLSKAEETQEQLDIQIYRDYENACKRFEKRIYDLEETRLVSIQMAPQIRLLQNSNQEVADKLRSDVINTIPLWRNQMVLALGLEHSRRALDAQSAVTEMTNEMFRRNAETLRQGAIDAAAASEKSIVDVETLKQVNADIIASINEVVKIHEEGTRRRAEAQGELAKIEKELKRALLDAGNR